MVPCQPGTSVRWNRTTWGRSPVVTSLQVAGSGWVTGHRRTRRVRTGEGTGRGHGAQRGGGGPRDAVQLLVADLHDEDGALGASGSIRLQHEAHAVAASQGGRGHRRAEEGVRHPQRGDRVCRLPGRRLPRRVVGPGDERVIERELPDAEGHVHIGDDPELVGEAGIGPEAHHRIAHCARQRQPRPGWDRDRRGSTPATVLPR